MYKCKIFVNVIKDRKKGKEIIAVVIRMYDVKVMYKILMPFCIQIMTHHSLAGGMIDYCTGCIVKILFTFLIINILY